MPRAVKPTSPAIRHLTYGDFGTLTKKRPEKSLVIHVKKHAGRDNQGTISIRHRGGGAKRLFRVIDFKLAEFEGVATVTAIEYDPNRSAFIALIDRPTADKQTEKAYIIAPEGLKIGDQLTSGTKRSYAIGSRLKLADIPIGYDVHNIELQPGRGGQIIRSAGSSATITAKEGKYAYVKLPSSEIRKVLLECRASIGTVSNGTHNRVRIAKAGRKRHMGFRPTVRGKAMNPNDHPHGGGEAVNPIGLKHPKTPWGKPALGKRTRHNKRTQKFIVTRKKK